MATLIFLLTILALLGTIITLPILVMRRRFSLACRLGGIILVWLILYAGLLLGFAWLTPQTVLAEGQEGCFDEMCFSVSAASRTISPTGDTVIVTLHLRNAARRGAEKPDHPKAYMVDGHGHAYYPLASGQPVWNELLQPGEIQSRMLHFHVPDAPVTLYLVVTEGSFPSPLIIGDNNSPFHTKTEFSITGRSFEEPAGKGVFQLYQGA